MYLNIFTTLMNASRFSILGGGGSCEMVGIVKWGITNGLYFYCPSAGTPFYETHLYIQQTVMVSITFFGSLLPKYGCLGQNCKADSEYIKCLCEETGLLTVKGTVILVPIITAVATIQFEWKFMAFG